VAFEFFCYFLMNGGLEKIEVWLLYRDGVNLPCCECGAEVMQRGIFVFCRQTIEIPVP
jgi:hypothetical protein